MKIVMKKAMLLVFISILSVLIITGCGGGGGGKKGGNDDGTGTDSKEWTSEKINSKLQLLNNAKSVTTNSQEETQPEGGPATGSRAASALFKSNYTRSSELGYFEQFEWSGPDADGWYTATNALPNSSLKFKPIDSKTFKFVDSLADSSEYQHDKGYVNQENNHSMELTVTQDDENSWHGVSISTYSFRVDGEYRYEDGTIIKWDNTNTGKTTLQVVKASTKDCTGVYVLDQDNTHIDGIGNIQTTQKTHKDYTITLNGDTYNITGKIQIDNQPAKDWNESWPK